ncbi:uncharacterized protein TNCV_2410401 [Trichonephila clavipes]|nr:uncharacterized protein TNCV_2410401 [Trichonephila clavipes]
MIRWALKLSEFNLEWEHRSGVQNVVADVLSRNPVEDIEHTFALSFAIEESCDKKVTAQFAIFVRYMSFEDPKEELLGLLSLSGQTRGEDIANAVQKCLEDNKIDLNKIVSIATDGARTFIVTPLDTNSNEIHIEKFGIDTGSLEMQSIDLKSKALWRGIEKQVRGPEM